MAKNSTEVRRLFIQSDELSYWSCSRSIVIVSRLYAHSKNYDMDLTLDYNIELCPLQKDESFALALASSLARGPPAASGAGEEEEKDKDVWRPDGKGTRGLEEDYDYVMYGKVGACDVRARTCMRCYIGGSRYSEGVQVWRRQCGNCVRPYLMPFHFFWMDSHIRGSTAYASFGGLLMSLTGSFRHMTSIVLGDPIFLLLRKWISPFRMSQKYLRSAGCRTILRRCCHYYLAYIIYFSLRYSRYWLLNTYLSWSLFANQWNFRHRLQGKCAACNCTHWRKWNGSTACPLPNRQGCKKATPIIYLRVSIPPDIWSQKIGR